MNLQFRPSEDRCWSCWLLLPLLMLLFLSSTPISPPSLQPCMAEAYFQQYTNLTCDAVSNDPFCYEFEVSNADKKAVGKSSFTWDLGDGRQKQGEIVEHCYDDFGTYRVSLYTHSIVEGVALQDTNFYEVEIKHVVAIDEENPRVDTQQGYFYYFDASGSFIENDVTPIGYYWDFGDGNYGCAELARNVYDEPGEYDVKLIVRGRSERGDNVVICGRKTIKIEQ